MFAVTSSATLVGARPCRVHVEAHVLSGKERFSLVGLPDTAVREAKDRVRAAITSSGFYFPNRALTVNLAPADIPKAGPAFDLPIALGVLASSGTIPTDATRVVAVGELALDGTVRRARGVVAAAVVAAEMGVPCIVPVDSAGDASVVEGADIRPVRSLAEAIAAGRDGFRRDVPLPVPANPTSIEDLSDVRGQVLARRAVEVAAAGGHHLLLIGPPGSGKSMLAKRLPGLLPELAGPERLEVLCIWEAADRRLPDGQRRPFRSPHHSASRAALLGGGSGHAVPGEITLSHRGVLFLDELGEFPSSVLDALRQPIEDGVIDIARRGSSVRYPARCQVVAATNPCPCGHRGDRHVACRCSDQAVERYRRKLSGPLLDRFDLRVWVGRPEQLDGPPGEGSAAVFDRITTAYDRQRRRGSPNAELSPRQLDRLDTDDGARRLLATACNTGVFNGRSYDRVRRVARTIADLAGRDQVVDSDIAEAAAFREAW